VTVDVVSKDEVRAAAAAAVSVTKHRLRVPASAILSAATTLSNVGRLDEQIGGVGNK
jgi:hypothetical protein